MYNIRQGDCIMNRLAEWLLSLQKRLEMKSKKKLFKRLKKNLKHKVEQDENGTIIITLNK